MFKNSIKYTLASLLLLEVTGCTTVPRTITIPTQREGTAVVHRPITSTPIQEEILLGRGSKNPSLGERVNVPSKNPSTGNTTTSHSTTDKNQTAPVVDTPAPREQHQEVIERIPFPVDEYRQLSKRGSSTLKGHIYLENVNTGEKLTKGKIKLWLNPVTSYSNQWYQESYLGGYRLSKSDSRLYNYLKFTYSNSDGTFSFFGLPRGEYYLSATMSCAKECEYATKKDVLLVKKVSVTGGTTNINLMKNVP